MRIGVPREIKVHEYRVGLVPAGVRELTAAGHEVLIETTAGNGIGVDDGQYRSAGAAIAANAAEVFERSDLVVKVKEPQLLECQMLRKGQVLFTYLHLAADPAQAKALMKSGATAIAYETVTAPNGSLPLLTPMSEVAGRMSIQVGAASLQKANGGFGILLGGVPGVPPAKVVILGGGVSGTHAAEMAVGLRADVTVVDRSVNRLRELSAQFGSALRTCYSTTETIEGLSERRRLHLVEIDHLADQHRATQVRRDQPHEPVRGIVGKALAFVAEDDETGNAGRRFLERGNYIVEPALWLRPLLIEACIDEFGVRDDIRVAHHIADSQSQIGRVQRIEFDVLLKIKLFVMRIDAERVV